MRNKAGQACLLFFAGWSQALASPEPAAQKGIQFNRDIRAILSDNCYACHGPDKNKRKAELRLDTREGLFGEIRGHAPVVPGKLEASELWRRVTTSDAEDRMPPAKNGKALSSDQIATLRRWIEEGAAWEGHWAYLKLARPPVPGPETEAGAEAF